MSDHTPRSTPPTRHRVPGGVEGHPSGQPQPQQPRFIISDGKDVELSGPSAHHSMLLAQLTEGRNRPGAAVSPNSVMLSVGGLPLMGPQSAFSLTRPALRPGMVPSQALFAQGPTGVPILRGSGLVSLTPDSIMGSVPRTSPQLQRTSPQLQRTSPQLQRTSPQLQRTSPQLQRASPQVQRASPQIQRASPQPQRASPHQQRLQVDRAIPTTVQGPDGPMVMLRVPSPMRSTTMRRSPSPNPPHVIVMDKGTKTATITGRGGHQGQLKRQHAVSTPPQVNVSRVSPNPMQQRAMLASNPLVNTLRVVTEQHRVSPGLTRVTTVTPRRVSPTPQQRVSPVPNRVSPVPHRVSPAPAHRPQQATAQQRVSPGPPRLSTSPALGPRATLPQAAPRVVTHPGMPAVVQRTSPSSVVHVTANRDSKDYRILHQNRAEVMNLQRKEPTHPQQQSQQQQQQQQQQQHSRSVNLGQHPGPQHPGPHHPGPQHRASTVSRPAPYPQPRIPHAEPPRTEPSSLTQYQSSIVTNKVTAGHRVSPGPPSRAAQSSAAQLNPRHTSVTVISSAESRTISRVSAGSQDSVNNPFAAAMMAAKNQSSSRVKEDDGGFHRGEPSSIMVMNQPATHPLKVKDEKPGSNPPVLRKEDTMEASPSTSTGRGDTERNTIQQPLLVKHLTTPVSSSSQQQSVWQNPPPLLPLLSSIMGLTPRTNSDLSSEAALELERRLQNSRTEAMPRLMPETLLQNHVNGAEAKPSLLNSIKTEDQDSDGDDKNLSAMDNPFSQRVRNLENFPQNPSSFKTTYRSQGMAVHRAKAGCIMNTAKSLDMLRHNIQKYINKEIDEVIQRYIDEFFKPGIENIRFNNGINAVSDDHMAAVSRQILEEAKRMYMTGSRCNTPDPHHDNVSDTGSLAPPENKTVRDKKLDLFKIKRRRGSSDSEASVTKKKRKGRPPLRGNGRSTPSKTGKNEPVKKEGPKWDPDRLNTETQFVMGARANKALGLGAQRGRLYIKHPDLFKYAGDQEDKNWLHEHHYMPATGGKAYLLVVEDIMDMAQSPEYKGAPGLMLGEVLGFAVPDWMVTKMKEQMRALRTDNPKPGKVKVMPPPPPDQEDTVPFCTVKQDSITDSKSDILPSPATTDLMSATEQDDDDPQSVSPLTLTGGFSEVSAHPPGVQGTHPPGIHPTGTLPLGEIEREEVVTPVTAPFDMT